MSQALLGVPGRSAKENERRLAIHPRHFERIDADLRTRILLEHDYGRPYGVSDDELAPLIRGFRDYTELVAEADIMLLPKPTLYDVSHLRDGQVLWGWPHCVQDFELTQVAIDKRLTLIAWEAMNHWTQDGRFVVHVFHINNELAGYASVLHAMSLRGFTGTYGKRRRAVLIGFGNTARGSVHALRALGVSEIAALTMRGTTAVADPIPGVDLTHLERLAGDPSRAVVLTRHGGPVPMAEFLGTFDIIVNCVLQDTDAPLMFVAADEVTYLRPGTLVVDVSCDAGMGFAFARPTTFEDPMFTVGHDLHYYGVDHSPSYLWESATWENSVALIPHLRSVLSGPSGWDASPTISRAIEIRDGKIRNPKILSFQHRSADYPHPLL